MFLVMGEILYYLKNTNNLIKVVVDDDVFEHGKSKEKIAMRVLESLKNQNVLGCVEYISDDNEKNNVI